VLTALVAAALLAPAWTPGLKAASAVVERLGAAKIDRAAHRVGMRRFHLDGASWFARLLRGLDRAP
jgi:hypothetical protein